MTENEQSDHNFLFFVAAAIVSSSAAIFITICCLCSLTGVLSALQQCFQLDYRYRAVEQESLVIITAMLVQEIQLLFRFDTFRQYTQLQPVRHGNDCSGNLTVDRSENPS